MLVDCCPWLCFGGKFRGLYQTMDLMSTLKETTDSAALFKINKSEISIQRRLVEPAQMLEWDAKRPNCLGQS